MRRLIPVVLLLMVFTVLMVGLAACGGTDSTPTSLPATPQANIGGGTTPGTTPFNPFIATITAGSSKNGGPGAPTATPNPTIVAPVASLPGIPVYANLKPVNLGVVGKQIAQEYSQNSPNTKAAIYYTSDSLDKIGGYYDDQMTKQGYKNLGSQPIPEASDLTGQILAYSKDASTNLVVIELGPLSASLIETFSQSSPAASAIQPGDNLVIMLSGLSPDLLSQLGKS